ncbi:Tetrahydrofolate synthase [Bertholletia excelsa]
MSSKQTVEVHLQLAPPLDVNLLNGLTLGLGGEHQCINAGLATALCSTWLQRTGHMEVNCLNHTSSLPKQFIKGLSMATLQGRAQIVPDHSLDTENSQDLVFYLDGAHSPESMEVCAKWFCHTIKEENKEKNCWNNDSSASCKMVDTYSCGSPKKNSTQILLFNCMSVRDPQLLLPCLFNACSNHGVCFKTALFAPNISVYNKVLSSALPPTDTQVDLSWQLNLQKLWEKLINGEKGRDANSEDPINEEGDKERSVGNCENSMVFSSLPLAIKWLQDRVQQNKSVRFQVLVTGSLHLVGDVLRLIKR